MPENPSTITVRRIFEHAAAAEWEEVEALHEPGFHCEDRRAGMGGRGGLLVQMANLRAIASIGSFELNEECLEVRGDRFSLCRYRFISLDPSPGFEVEILAVNQVNDSGLMQFYATFDPSDLDAALAELDNRSALPG